MANYGYPDSQVAKGYAGNTIGPECPSRISALDRLHQQVESLHQRIEMTEKALAVVLRPDTPNLQKHPPEVREVASPTRSGILAAIDRLQLAEARLVDLAARCDLDA